jgi:hypothetical protein
VTGGVVSASAIASYEDGYRSIKIDVLDALCVALGRSVRAVVGEAERRVEAFRKSQEVTRFDGGAVVVRLSTLARCTRPELQPLQRWARASVSSSRTGEVLLGWGGVAALAEIAGVDPDECAEILLTLSESESPFGPAQSARV